MIICDLEILILELGGRCLENKIINYVIQEPNSRDPGFNKIKWNPILEARGRRRYGG
jgi:hypothetical protein